MISGVGIDGIFDSLERRDVNFDRARESIIQPPSSSAPVSITFHKIVELLLLYFVDIF